MLSNRFFWTLENQMKGLGCCFLWTIFGGWIWPKRQFFQGFKLWWELYIYMYSAMAFCGHNLCWKIAISSCLFSSTFICRGKNDYTGWLYSKQIWNLLTAVATGFPYDGRLLWYLWQGSLKSPSSKSQRGGGTSLPSATSPGQACKQFLSGVPKCLYSVQIYTTSAF